MNSKEYDVTIADASLGGCSSAILMGREGLRVALLERRKHIDAYKQVCTMFIQSSALPIIERLRFKSVIRPVAI